MKNKKPMLLAFYILGTLVLVFLFGKINRYFQFKNQVKTLFSLSKPVSHKAFNYSQLDSLPEPVQRYFKRVLKNGQPYIGYMRMTHDGQFKSGPDKLWTDIKGEQYATTERPGFIWKGTTSMFVARDMYIADKGRLVVSLFSLYNIVDAKGPNYNQGELLRWLGESVLYPTNLLPSERLQWSAIDSKRAKLTFDYDGLSLFFIMTFNEIGEITEMETKRYMDENKLETWIIKAGKYKEINEVLVPTVFEVLWRLDTGDLSYAKFNVKTIEFNRPENF